MNIRSKKIRRKVSNRAEDRCEYCKIHERDSYLTFEVEHIVSQKHGGGDELENLAFACPHCNQHKGTDLTTFLTSYEDIVRIFHPRKHDWFEFFSFEDSGEILPKNRIAEATIKLLKLNEFERIIIRKILIEAGRYP